MDGEYVYNEKTGMLHVKGCCPYTRNGIPCKCKVFATQNDAIAYGGDAVQFCQVCQETMYLVRGNGGLKQKIKKELKNAIKEEEAALKGLDGDKLRYMQESIKWKKDILNKYD